MTTPDTLEIPLSSFSLEIQTASQYTDGATVFLSRSTTATTSSGKTENTRAPAKKERIKRKLRGILLSADDGYARVVFESDDGEPIEYDLGKDLLKQNGVTVPNQPFELIEGVRFLSKTEMEQFTKIIPLAPANSAQIAPLDLPEQTKSKLQNIFARLKAKS